MYRSFYGFREKPFSMTPDPDFLYISKNHKEAFAHLLYGIRYKAGFIELTGEVGSGKTTILRTLFDQLDKDNHRTALIFNPCLSALELLQNINKEYGIPSDDLNNAKLINSLNEFLLQENAAGRTVVLVIDEAQNLDPGVLEQIRLISNLETEKDKLIQILLVGQPELEEILNKSEMRQLSQRITVHYHLKPMDYEDTVAYIKHRLDVAGGNGRVTFSTTALKKIFRYSKGLPRLINIAGERALMAGYMKNAFLISRRMAGTGIADVTRITKPNYFKRWFVPAGLFLLVSVLGAGVFFSNYSVRAKSTSEKVAVLEPSQTTSGLRTLEFSKAAGKEPVLAEEIANFSATFNAIAPFYHIALLAEDEKKSTLDKAFQKRGLQLYRYNGNLGRLTRLDCPAIMELNIPDVRGARYVTLTGAEIDRFLTTPRILGKTSLTGAELESLWTGRSFIPWKNAKDIPFAKVIGLRGGQVKQLQSLLTEASVYNGQPTGVYDKATKEAVRKFQEQEGISPDGIVGNQTLFLLYLKADRLSVPSLSKKVRKEAG